LNREEIYFNSKVYICNLIEYVIALLTIKYNHKVAAIVEQSGNPMIGYHSYFQFDCLVKAKVYWEVVLLILASSSQLPNNMSLQKQVPIVYDE
jgi:hypothetical protein